jgi:hypothetical protein
MDAEDECEDDEQFRIKEDEIDEEGDFSTVMDRCC